MHDTQRPARVLDISRRTKRVVAGAADLLCMLAALWGAFALRMGDWLSFRLTESLPELLLVPLLSLPIFHALGVYRTVVRYLGMQVLRPLLLASLASAGVFMAVVALLRLDLVPRSTPLIYPLLLVVLLTGMRVGARRLLLGRAALTGPGHPVVVYGAGTAGVQLVSMLEHGGAYRPVAFVDDDPAKARTEVRGLRVHHPDELPALVERLAVTDVLLAVPSATRRRRQEIFEGLEALPVRVRTIPGLADIVSGAARVDELREVDIEDLLGRDPVPPDLELLDRCIANRSVLVTGAGGSIGGELCRQILARRPRRLLLFEQNEFSLYDIERELRGLVDARSLDTELVPVLGTVLDRELLARAMRRSAVETVYHAAAYKHVPMVETNPAEGVRNNVFGTLAAVRAAGEAGVRRFVLVSTDKAVRPANVMGASKRVAELLLQALAARGDGPMLSMVRFGNVLGSSGSVVPLFREQIRRGGPVTVTDPRIIRYFMTVPEAAQLVLQAGALAEGGDVFVLDMGRPVKIVDLARRMIALSGLTVRDEANPDGDIEIAVTGLRRGEKLYEELLLGDHTSPSGHPMILRAREQHLDWPVLEKRLEILGAHCAQGDEAGIRHQLATLVDGYTGEVDRRRRVTEDVQGV